MRPLLFILWICFFLSKPGYAQQNKNIKELLQEAADFKNKGDFLKALAIHKNIFAKNASNKTNISEQAEVYGYLSQKDSCRKYLQLSIRKSPKLDLLANPAFLFLHNEPEWSIIQDYIFQKNERVVDRIKNIEYAKQIYSVCAVDKSYYERIERAQNKYGRQSLEVKQIIKRNQHINELNQIKFQYLLKKNGWPRRSVTGFFATKCAYQICKNGNLDILKPYIPTMKNYCQLFEGSCQSYAVLFDRMQLELGQPQRFGTQLNYNSKTDSMELYPLENRDMLPEYRAWVGLKPLKNSLLKKASKNEKDTNSINLCYADSLIDFTLKPYEKFNYPYGMELPEPGTPHSTFDVKIIPLDPKVILDDKIDYCLALPKGSELIVHFRKNQIIDYPGQDDLFIMEYGASGEEAIVSVSAQGKKFDSLGITTGGLTGSLDLEDINFKKPVRYVKLKSSDSKGGVPGFDLVYIKGVPNAAIPADLDSLQIVAYKIKALKELKALRYLEKHKPQPFELKHLHFGTKSSIIQKESYSYLVRLLNFIKDLKCQKIELVGHTDNVGKAEDNMALSLARITSVKEYLLNNGVTKTEIIVTGKGETEPLSSNGSSKGRAINRRVELHILK